MLIKNFLFSLGSHIGGKKQTFKSFYKSFLLGFRSDYCIYDINYIVYFLKKTSNFFFFLGFFQSRILFYSNNNYDNRELVKGFFYSNLFKFNHFYIDEKWSFGMYSNMITCCRHLFFDLFKYKEQKRQNKSYSFYENISFFNFFLKTLLFFFHSKPPGKDWQLHFNKMQKYWRFFLLYKFYKNLNRFPDAFLYFSDRNFGFPVNELYKYKIPIVSLIDSDYSFFYKVSYPMISNSKNFFLHVFYFSILIKSYHKGLLKSYEFFFDF